MKKLLEMMSKLRRDEKGATVIEYALIAALVAVVAIAGFTTVGQKVSTKMSAVGSALT